MILTPEMIVRAYEAGLFPMAENASDASVYWFDPEMRGILPIDKPHIPKRLWRSVRQRKFEVRVDSAFAAVIESCAEAVEGREKTWINRAIHDAYIALHHRGLAHSIESWLDGKLVGGVYGVSLGGAFFGESMFSRVTDASKVALVHLLARLRHGGFQLLDTQFINPHLLQFGALEIPASRYRILLNQSLCLKANFQCGDEDTILQSLIQTS